MIPFYPSLAKLSIDSSKRKIKNPDKRYNTFCKVCNENINYGESDICTFTIHNNEYKEFIQCPFCMNEICVKTETLE